MEPQDRIGLAPLSQIAFDGLDLGPLREELLSTALKHPDAAGLLMDLSVIDQIQGHPDTGLAWQAQALTLSRAFRTNKRRDGQPRLLIIARAREMGGNTPVEFLLQGSEFELITFYPDMNAPNAPLPDHDIAFCAAPADSPDARAFYDYVQVLTQNSGVRVFNLPARAVNLDRDALCDTFADVPGLRLPDTRRLSRAALEQDMIDGPYPCLIRPVGAHAGAGLARLSDTQGLLDYLAAHNDPSFFVSEFVEYATPADALYRKYRIVFVGGRAFPCHMAIADRWDVWYLNSDMAASPAKRAEEAAFMTGFDADFSKRHAAAFDAITSAVDLEYFGIDCAEDTQGNLVVFEADNALIVHDMDPVDTFPYKPAQMRQIFAAFARLLRTELRARKAAKTSRVKRRGAAAA